MDVAVIEVGIGGRFDCTNILPCPVVCGMTTLSLEHTNLLGHSLKEIAWHKCGIFKQNSMACVIDQSPNDEINSYAEKLAKEVGSSFELVKIRDNIMAGTSGTYQALNASLALTISRKWLESKFPRVPIDEAKMIASISNTKVHGRQQIVNLGDCPIYLDVAHTHESLEDTLKWFKSSMKADKDRNVLFFFCSSPRCPETLLHPFIMSGIFAKIYWPSLPHSHESLDPVKNICKQAGLDLQVIPCENIKYALNVEIEAGSVILGCGSFYLVGEMYRLIASSLQD